MITDAGLLEGLEMELTTVDVLSQALPPLVPLEEMRLTTKLEKEGCEETVKVFILDGKYVIIDGHNRYRICRRLRIPFKVEVLPVKTLEEAKEWLLENQLARRNVSDFVKCEYALARRDALIEVGRQRQGRKKGDPAVLPNLVKLDEPFNTQKYLADLAGVSKGTLDSAKWLMENAAERTKEDLRKGTISIHMAISETKSLLKGDDQEIRRRVFNGELTIQKIVEDRKKEAKRKKGTAAMELRLTSPVDEEGENEDDVEDIDADYWNGTDEMDDDSSHGGKIVSLFGKPKQNQLTGAMAGSFIAGGYEGVFSQHNKHVETQGKIVPIIPYQNSKGWNPKDFGEEASEAVGEPNDEPKGKIFSLIPHLNAKGCLPIDYEAPGDYEQQEEYEHEDEEEGYGEQDFREDEVDEPLVSERRVVNIDDIKICDPVMPLPTRGVSLMSAVNEQDSNCTDRNDMGRDDNDMLQRIRTKGVCVHTANFDEIVSEMKRVTRNFEKDVAVLLTAIRLEDRTEENGTQVTDILNDSINTVINKYTEVFLNEEEQRR